MDSSAGRRRPNPLDDRHADPNLLVGLDQAEAVAQASPDGGFFVPAHGRAPHDLALSLCPRKSGVDALLDHSSLELGEYAHHLKQHLAGRRRGIEALLMQV